MIVAGGIYLEYCVVPPWDEYYGSAGRAVEALGRGGATVSVYGYADEDARAQIEARGGCRPFQHDEYFGKLHQWGGDAVRASRFRRSEGQGRKLGPSCPEGATRSEQSASRFQKGEYRMLWTIFVVLLILWLLGMVTSYTLYGYIHILLLIAVVVLVIRLIQGRRVV